MKYTFIDLFAGIGGFHLGLHNVGMKCVFASEIDESARKSYESNFKKVTPELFENNLFNKDIYELNTDDIPEFNLICGGFPCQPFSQIGKKKGFSEELEGRGNLFYEILRIIKDKKPDGFFLENVSISGNGFVFLVFKDTQSNLVSPLIVTLFIPMLLSNSFE